MAALRLHNALLEAVVLPEVGGGLAVFDWIGAGGPLPLMRRLPAGVKASDPNSLACYPLVPWSNRIGHGRFAFEGKSFQLAPNYPNEPYPIHGDGWLSAWNVLKQSDYALTLELDKSSCSPFAYTASLSYALDAGALAVQLMVENRGSDRMLFGLGLHPWFDRTPGVELRAPAQGMWIAGADILPVEQTAPPADARFDEFKPLPERGIDNCFGGWTGLAVIRWQDRGVELRIETSPRLSYYVLFCPDGKPLFCFEPVTHPIDAFNLPEPFARAGLAALAPGQTLSIGVTFRAAPLASA